MTEYIYIVTVGSVIIGSFDVIENAALFIKAYFDEYYNEPFELTIRRVAKNEEKPDV